MRRDPPTVDLVALKTALTALAGPKINCAAAKAENVDAQLFPEERGHLKRAAEQRRCEFGTARVLARNVLSGMGWVPQSLVPNEDRSPRWPADVVGSMTHSHGYCAVAVARSDAVAGIGLDLERAVALREGMELKVATERERQWLRRCDTQRRPWLAALLFSAKEAFYKCQHPLTHTWLDFQDVELSINLRTQSFCISHFSDAVPDPTRLRRVRGAWRHVPDFIVTMASLD
jgi:4'-phosphopantetheinyl transferase EntD